jgi:hypothetical protein
MEQTRRGFVGTLLGAAAVALGWKTAEAAKTDSPVFSEGGPWVSPELDLRQTADGETFVRFTYEARGADHVDVTVYEPNTPVHSNDPSQVHYPACPTSGDFVLKRSLYGTRTVVFSAVSRRGMTSQSYTIPPPFLNDGRVEFWTGRPGSPDSRLIATSILDESCLVPIINGQTVKVSGYSVVL